MRALLALALVLAVVLPLVAASGVPPPQGAARIDFGGRVAYHWISNESELSNASRVAATSVPAGAPGYVWVGVQVDPQATNATNLTFYVNVSSSALSFQNSSAVVTKSFAGVVTSEEFHYASFAFAAPANASSASYHVSVQGYATNASGNATALPPGSGDGTIALGSAVVPAPAPGVPAWAWYAGGAGALLVLGVAVYAVRERNLRKRMRGSTRSQALREAELEELAQKKPERAAEIKQEIRQAEQVRVKRREVQILEAKRDDVVKTMDMLRKRHEMGALSKLQYDNMVAKKRAELQKIEADIAAMEAQDEGGAASA